MLEALEADPAADAVCGLDAAGARAWRHSAGELLERAGAWQSHLSRVGVEPGDRVGIDVERGPELLPAHLAVLASGACAVPLNSALTERERSRVLARADLRTLLGPADTPGRRGGGLRLAALDDTRPALLIFTSGTTGEPKGVPLSLANLEANLSALAQTWRLDRADRLLHVLPAHHVHGLVLALYGSARLGIPLLLAPRFEAEPCLRALGCEAASVLMAVPTMYHRLVRAPAAPDLSHMRVFISGSAPLAAQDFRDFAKRFGHAPVERYGLSETLIAASNPLDGERRPGTVGLPLPGTEVRLAADGEIELRGPAVMSGYFRDPVTSAASFDGDFFRTGDLGHHDAAGYLVVAGRKKDLIIVGGSNVLPGEVELVLAEDPGVDEVAVAGLPDADRGEIVAAFVVARAGTDPKRLEGDLRARAEVDLSAYKRPRSYQFMAALPRNAMGKIDRRRLREG